MPHAFGRHSFRAQARDDREALADHRPHHARTVVPHRSAGPGGWFWRGELNNTRQENRSKARTRFRFTRPVGHDRKYWRMLELCMRHGGQPPSQFHWVPRPAKTGQLGSPDHCGHAAPRGLWGGSKPSQTAEGHSTSA
eukprot:scaffold18917_cov59-Phaeocystis_antarctica.AAC.3